MTGDTSRQEVGTSSHLATTTNGVTDGERWLQELAALRRVLSALVASRNPDEILHIILHIVVDTLGFDFATIAFVDVAHGIIRGKLGTNQDADAIQAIAERLDGDGPRASVLTTGHLLQIEGWDSRAERRTLEIYGHHSYATIYGPITVFGERIGVLDASRQRSTRAPISDHDRALFALLLDNAGLALQNARVLDSERTKTQRLWAVNEITRRTTSVLRLDDLLQQAATLLREAFNYQHVSILLPEGDGAHILQRVAFSSLTLKSVPELRLPQGTGMTGWTFITGQAQLASDTRLDRHFVQTPGLLTLSELDVPLRVGGETIGVVSIESDAPGGLEEDDVPFLQTLADQIAIAIHNSRQYEAVNRQREQLGAINAVSRQISSVMTTKELLPFVVQLLWNTFHTYSVSLFQATDDGLLQLAAALGGEPGPMPVGSTLRVGVDGIVGWVAATGKPLLSDDVRLDAHYLAYPGLPETRAEVAVPILSGKRVVGVLDMQSDKVNAFDLLDQTTLQTLADQVGIALENARLYEGLQRRTAQVMGLHEAGRAIAASLELNEILQAIIVEVSGRLGFDRCAVALRSGSDALFHGALASDADGKVTAWDIPTTSVPVLGEDLAESVRRAWVVHVRAPGGEVDATTHLMEDTCTMAMPLRVRGTLIGALVVDNLVTSRHIDAEHSETLEAFVNQAAIAIDHARLYQEVISRAHALEVANQQLSELDRMKSHFISMVSHELRTPLGLIKGYVGTLLRDDVSLTPESQREFLKIIEEESDTLTDLVGNLLDASRLEAGTLAMELHPTRLAPTIRKAVADAEKRAPDYMFHLNIASELPLVQSDARRIQQVIRNLLDNAVKYSPVNKNIELAAYEELGSLVITVTDHGEGIDSNDLSRIFDRFYRVDQTDSRLGGGSGLGLTIARGIVEGHGGTLTVDSVKGAGSTFRVSIPVG